MKILITGGAGFIGSHLAVRLLNNGHHVCVIDDLSTGSIENIYGLKYNSNFRYVIDTIMSVNIMAELVDDVDIIYHLAASVGVNLIVEDPVKTIETNVKGTEIVLKLANKKKKLVVITSTSEVYGKSNDLPFREDGDLTLGSSYKARWSYACSKLLDEFLAMAYHRDKKLPVVIVRLFNTTGPRQTGRYGMVVPRFIKQALAAKPITVYGDGKQTRCFCYVGDVVWALTELIKHETAIGNIFNIGSDHEVTIADLAKMVNEKINSSSKIVFVPYDEAYCEGFEDMTRRVPDISKISKLTGFKPKVRLPEIIESMIEYYAQKG